MADERKIGVGFGVLLLREDKILLGKRHEDPNKASSLLKGAATWTMPGGKLHFREQFEDGAKREVQEETGITLNSATVIAHNTLLGIEVEVSDFSKTIKNNLVKDRAAGLTHLTTKRRHWKNSTRQTTEDRIQRILIPRFRATPLVARLHDSERSQSSVDCTQGLQLQASGARETRE